MFASKSSIWPDTLVGSGFIYNGIFIGTASKINCLAGQLLITGTIIQQGTLEESNLLFNKGERHMFLATASHKDAQNSL
jgi:hypothetical protein